MKNVTVLILLSMFTVSDLCAQWTTSGSNIYNTNSGGNVGIGTTAPDAPLSIKGTSTDHTITVTSIANVATESAGIRFQSRASVYYDGTYGGLKLNTADFSKPIIFGNSGTIGQGEFARFTGDGKLGIGTANPAYTLDVNGKIRTNNGLIVAGYAGINNSLSFSNGSLYIEGNTGGNIYLRPNGTGSNMGLFTVSTTGFTSTGAGNNSIAGNLGVGTTSPSFRLDVAGKIGSNGTQIVYLPDQANLGGSLIIGNGGTNLSHTTGTDGKYNTVVGLLSGTALTSGASNTGLGYAALTALTTGTNNTAIGTSALYSLTTGVQNTAIGYATLFANTGNYNIAIGASAGRFIADGATANTTGGSSTFIGYGSRASANGDVNEIVIGYAAIGNGSNSVTLGNTSIAKTILQGNIGIGTLTPQVKLDVNGNIYSHGKIFIGTPDANTLTAIAPYSLAVNGSAIFTKAVVKSNTAWPDYVFATDYKMPHLDSLEQFIKANGHLPEIPKAETVEKDGIDLGNNQALLLKKIEELTLIVIEQNKQNQNLAKMLKEQNKKIEEQSKTISELEEFKKTLEAK